MGRAPPVDRTGIAATHTVAGNEDILQFLFASATSWKLRGNLTLRQGGLLLEAALARHRCCQRGHFALLVRKSGTLDIIEIFRDEGDPSG
jgi:hypothetical protein